MLSPPRTSGVSDKSPRLAAQHLLHRAAAGQLVDDLVEMRTLRISGSSIASTCTRHTLPAIRATFGLSSAASKNSAKVDPSANYASSSAWSNPVSRRITSSSSARVRPFFSTFVT